jgi:hypothetical protein
MWIMSVLTHADHRSLAALGQELHSSLRLDVELPRLLAGVLVTLHMMINKRPIDLIQTAARSPSNT